ncbi:hypothetical protein Q5H91_07270 [Sphingomonas sp. KR1UV-12]|uniref:Uncharacterized protein n=1 Tax=Sphingomonas aurea TaxID=3063994 RepID=A0ABT9EJJ2_9SPHN|nr:hypothetical protein [Sphingomonas sp. KR1UV-12]MDP1027007.1 hypothetical protein [Sphingomonas sp. KR1UV-12]
MMMTEPEASEPTIESFADLPIQPTGSGVADLEIAYEQMKLADEAGAGGDMASVGGADDPRALAAVPTEISDDAVESSAHPS